MCTGIRMLSKIPTRSESAVRGPPPLLHGARAAQYRSGFDMDDHTRRSGARRAASAPSRSRRRVVIGVSVFLLTLGIVLATIGGGDQTARTVSAPGRSCASARPPGDATCSPAWRSTFSGTWFDQERWSYWGTDEDPYVGLSIADPRSVGLPRLEGKSVRFEVTQEDVEQGNWDSKLYKELDVTQGAPRLGVGGTYRAWFLLSPEYSLNSDPGLDASVNIFQFKDRYRIGINAEAGSRSDPTWWVELRPRAWVDEIARSNRSGNVEWALPPSPSQSPPDHPVAFVNHREAENNSRRFKALALPLGRWFEVTAKVDTGRRIDFWFREQGSVERLHVGGGDHDADFPVGPCQESARFPEYCHGPLSSRWIFGIGHYGKNVGSLFSDDASFTPALDAGP